MKAVILAAGKGTRMRDLTKLLPKPMLRVQSKPILQHIVEGLKTAGIKDFCIVTGWQSQSIEDYFGDGSKFGVNIAYAKQEVQNGTGKAAEPAKGFIGSSDFILTYGDILVYPTTYSEMLKRFDQGQFSGLITVTAGEDISKGGLCFFGDDQCLVSLVEKPSAEQIDQLRQQGLIRPGQPLWYNAGIYIFKPVLFEFTAKLSLSPRNEYELTDAISAMVKYGHKIVGHQIKGRWVDVRDPETLAKLEAKTENLLSDS
jgi:dTDP-glucose pyrophosphorylase